MALSISQQIFQNIERSKNILITFRQHWPVDAVASALALSHVLARMEKPNTIAVTGFQAPPHLGFLKGIEKIKPGLEAMRKFLVSLALHGVEVEEFSYDIIDNKLIISITPRRGFFAPEDVTTGSSDWRYDLVIALGTPDLESLGALYNENTEFFYKTPTINIDHSAHNEHFGSINLVDVTSAATAEVVAHLLESWDPKLMNEDVATSLLAGIIAETESYRLPSVTPQTLALSGRLVSQGAQRELVVNNLYRTKTVTALKLWGRALARMKSDALAQMVWSVLPKADFERAGGTIADLAGVVDELMIAVPKTRLALLIAEDPAEPLVRVYVRATDRHLDAAHMLGRYRAEGDRVNARAAISGMPLVVAEREVVDELRSKLLNIKV